MPSISLLFLATIPAILLLLPRWIEPYSLFDPAVLNNRPGFSGRTTRWCNMGWWENTDIFPEAAQALAQKLLDLATDEAGGYKGGGTVLDIAHGSGESLLLHLSSPHAPRHLSALTALASDTAHAQNLVSSSSILGGESATKVDFFTFAAQFRPGKDVGHPLDRMRGYLGESSPSKKTPWDEDDFDFDSEAEVIHSELQSEPPLTSPSHGYDLIYILDAIYHFPPSLSAFLTSLLPVLAEDGVVAYTDLLPPPTLSLPVKWLLSQFLSVPWDNLNRSPDLRKYEDQIKSLGYEDVLVEDWSEGVWSGFARNLRERGGSWKLVSRVVERAEKDGWKFIAVRAKKSSSSK